MPATTVDVPSVGLVEFPEGMSDEDISSTIQNSILPERAAKKEALTQEMSAARSEVIPRLAGPVADVAEKIGQGLSQANPITYFPRLAFELDRALGVVPKDQENPYDANKPLMTPEAAKHALDMIGGPPEVGTALAGARDFAAETISGMSSPNMATAVALSGPAAALSGVGPGVIAATRAGLATAFAGQMASQAPEAFQAFNEARKTGDAQEQARTGLNLLAAAGIPLAITAGAVKGSFTTPLEKVAPETSKALETVGIEKGSQNAEQITETTQLHGDVRPQSEQIQSEVSPEVRSEGVPSSGLQPEPAPKAPPDQIIGMGGARPYEFGKPSAIRELTQVIAEQPESEKMSLSDRMDRTWRQVTAYAKDAVESTLGNISAKGTQIWKSISDVPQWTNYQDKLGDMLLAIQKNDFDVYEFDKQIKKTIPNDLKREGMVNWIQADGDPTLLAERASLAKGDYKRGYEEALNLTEDEKTTAKNVASYLDDKLKQGIDAGILREGIDNYITQLWEKPNPITDQLRADIAIGKLPVNFQFARKRIFESYFEGEQAGYKPRAKDIGHLLAIYDQAFTRSIAARAFIRQLKEGTAEDGRPLVEISGGRVALPNQEAPEAILIKPKLKPEEMGDYLRIDHPALSGWKYAATDEKTGATVLYPGDMLVHPSIYEHLKNVLSTSKLRQIPITNWLLKGQSFLKQSKLSLSLFHQVQEGIHAVFHRISPFNPPDIKLDNPTQAGLVKHGLQIADYRAWQDFAEGLGGKGGIMERSPGVGPLLQRYNEYLFKEYIPRLKMSMATHALERNLEKYSGKLTKDQIQALTARQANAAFGELNYKAMGRSPFLQDVFMITALAPDFLEARMRFVGQAATKYGSEQRIALGLMAATLWVTSRVINQISTGDPHITDKPFTVIVGDKEYGLRTIAGDIQHLLHDPRQFIYNRLSPIVRMGTEFATGRDDRGIKREHIEQLKDLLSWLAPISLEKLNPLSDRKTEQTTLETLAKSSGVFMFDTGPNKEIRQKAFDWKKSTGNQSKEEKAGLIMASDYKDLRVALERNDAKDAAEQYGKLIASGKTPARIFAYFQGAIDRPITGSAKLEKQFRNSLSESEKAIYDSARKQRLETYERLVKMARAAKKQSP